MKILLIAAPLWFIAYLFYADSKQVEVEYSIEELEALSIEEMVNYLLAQPECVQHNNSVVCEDD